MPEIEASQWPEHVGSNNWIPLDAITGLTEELTELLVSEAANGWIRAVTDAEALFTTAWLELFWIADGCLNFAVIAGSSRPWQVMWRRTLPLEQLAPMAQVWPAAAH